MVWCQLSLCAQRDGLSGVSFRSVYTELLVKFLNAATVKLRSVCFSMPESLKEISLFNILNNSFIGTGALTLGSVGPWPFQSSLFASS